jgi:hypothetical protein
MVPPELSLEKMFRNENIPNLEEVTVNENRIHHEIVQELDVIA